MRAARCAARRRGKHRPSRRYRLPKLASQMRVAFSSMAWNTGSSSPGELLMTLSTSEVAVCCSSDSVSSRCAPAPRRTAARSRSLSPPGRRTSRPVRSASRLKAAPRCVHVRTPSLPRAATARRAACGCATLALGPAAFRIGQDVRKWTVRPSISARPKTVRDLVVTGSARDSRAVRATSRRSRQRVGFALAPTDHAVIRFAQRAADSTSVSSTACRSNVERLMTLSTSAVAVCCCSDSRSSLSSRVFSMAMTAWAANS